MLSSSAVPSDMIIQTIKDDAIRFSLQKGQKVLYEGEEAEVLSVRPVLIIKIKAKKRVICGNLYKDIYAVQKDTH
jgi:hypothetical protein